MHAHSLILARPKPVRRDVALILSTGFLATLAMTTIMYLLPLFGMERVDLSTWTARLFVVDPVAVGILGIGLHVCLGFGYAWLFADQVEPRLNVGPGQAGLLFGAALWTFAQVVAVPILGAFAGAMSHLPVQPPGLFSAHLGPGAALASLIAHLAYGGTLGAVYGCHFGGKCR